MSFVPRVLAWPHWRPAGVAALLAAAGGGVRWMSGQHSSGGEPDHFLPDSPAGAAAAAFSAARPVTLPVAKSLLALSGQRRLQTLAAALPYMTAKEIAPMVAELAPLFHDGSGGARDPVNEAVLRALCLRWSEVDAPGMIAALQSADYRYLPQARQIAVSACAELKGAEAVKAVAKQWPGLACRAAWETVWRHPEQMESLLPLLGPRSEWWSPANEDDTVIELLGPERSVRLAQAAGERDFAMKTVLGLSATEPLRALLIAKSMRQGDCRDYVLLNLLREMDPMDNTGTGSLFPAEGGLEAQGNLFAANGLSFRAEYEALPPGEVRDTLAFNYARSLAAENAEAARAWAESQPPGKGRFHALQGVLQSIEESEETMAEKMMLSVEVWRARPRDADYPVVPSDRFVGWLQADPAAAEAWLKTQNDPVLRAGLAPLLFALGNGSDWSLLPTSEDRMNAAVNILTGNNADPFATGPSPPPPDVIPAEWRHEAELAAALQGYFTEKDWAEASPEDRRILSPAALRHYANEHTAVETLEFFQTMAPEDRSLSTWYAAGSMTVSKDLEAASQWMKSLAPGPERDAAATALVKYLTETAEFMLTDPFAEPSASRGGEKDGPAAFAWASSMSGEQERRRYMATAAKVWAETDAAAARAAVTASHLPEPDKKALLQQLPAEGGAK